MDAEKCSSDLQVEVFDSLVSLCWGAPQQYGAEVLGTEPRVVPSCTSARHPGTACETSCILYDACPCSSGGFQEGVRNLVLSTT